MAEMTLEQKKALALASARKRMQEAAGSTPATTDQGGMLSYLEKAGDLARIANPAAYLADSLTNSVIKDATSDKKTDARDTTVGKVDSFIRGAADTASFGFADEMSAAADSALNPVLGTGEDDESFTKRYAKNISKERATDRADAENRFKQRLSGQLTGGMLQGGALLKAGLSPTASAIEAGKSLPRVMATGALEGGTLGAVQGLGSGTDVEDRAKKAAIGTFVGGALGGAIPGVTALAQKIATPVAAYLNPDRAKDKVMAALMQRAEMTPDDLATSLQAAQDDGQNMFMAADALGNPTQRVMSTAARTPSDARKAVVDALVDRQTGQSDRLGQYLAEGFDAPDTAAQRVASLTEARDAAANSDYSALRANVGDMPLWGDDLQALTSRPSVQRAINDARSIAAERGYQVTNPFQAADDGTLSLPEGTAPNFTFWDTVKRGLDRQIATDPTNRDLVSTKRALTGILDDIVPGYAEAREPFMKASRAIDAVDAGRRAASSRVRSNDSIAAFEAMSPEEQAAFRAGYVDPTIARIEGASISPTTNKARPLMTSKSGDEFPAFAAPGRAEQLGDRIAREQRMFETANAALGGSKTADNLADMADSAIDPGIIAALARGNLKDAALSAITKTANSARGLPPSVIEKLVPALMETNPQYARELFSKSAQVQQLSDEARAKIVAALMSSGAAVPSRIAP
jgi:ParB-like chromosome segregation protein Spo0J